MGKNTRVWIVTIAVVLAAGCKSHAPKKGTAGELCIAENKPEHMIEGKGPITEKMEVAVYDQRLTLPNPEKLVKDVGGLAVTMFKDGKKYESVRLDFAKRKTDKLCLYFRPAAEHAAGGGWKLDNGDHPRCHCWGAPAAGSAAPAGAGSAAPAGSPAPAGTAAPAGSAAAGSAAPAAGSAAAAGSAKP